MSTLGDLKIKIFADGADLDGMLALARNPLVKGYTTNPTLMRKAGVTDYAAFAGSVLAHITEEPVSFEVFADDFAAMEEQALTIASWARNVYVKIPITNTKGESSCPLITRLARAGVQLNVTALFTERQVAEVAAALDPAMPAIVSVFAGRIADTGVDPLPLMRNCLTILKDRPGAELLWASPRELLNIFQADSIGCHIITVTHDVLAKLGTVGKELDRFSLETVQMFYGDAVAAGYDIPRTRIAAE